MKSFVRLACVIVAMALTAMAIVACGSTPAAAPAATTAPAKPAAAEPTKAVAPAVAPAAAPAVAPAVAPAAATYPKMDIKVGHGGVTDMSYHKGNIEFSELVKERSGGNINIQVFPNSQLGSEKDMLEQVKNGVIQMSLTTPAMLANYEGWGAIGATAMPYIFKGDTDEEQYPRLMKLTSSAFMKDVNDKAAATSGIRALDLGWWYGTRNLTTKSKQVTKPEDMKGLKIRTMDNPMSRAALNALGAATTPMAVAELYSAMQMGVVEGQENPLNTIFTSKYYEVQNHLSLTGHMTMTVHMVTNDKWFKGLPANVQDLVQTAMNDAGKYQSDIQLKANKQNLEDLKGKGMTVSTVNKAEFAAVTKDAWKEFENVFGKGTYEKIVEEANK